MALLKIATIGNPVLRQRAREVGREELAGAEMQRFIVRPARAPYFSWPPR